MTGAQERSGLVIEPPFEGLLAAHGLTSLDAVFAIQNGREMTKPGLPAWRERIRLELAEPDGGERSFFLKRYSAPPVREQVRRLLSGIARHGTAWVEWNWMRALARCGVEAVVPAAFGEEMTGPWERRSALMTVAVPGASLERRVHERPGRLPEALRDELARFISRFHGRGFVHRDLYLSHIFVDESRGSAPALRLIDVQRVLRPRWRHRRWIVKDLAALNYSTPVSAASVTDRLRWLRVYLGVSRLGGRDRSLVRRIVAKTERIARHDARLRASRPSVAEGPSCEWR